MRMDYKGWRVNEKDSTYSDEKIAVGRAGARDLNGFTIRAGHGAIAVASTYTKQYTKRR